MKQLSINKYLFYSGWVILFLFVLVTVSINYFNRDRGYLTLTIRNGMSGNMGHPVEGLIDPKHKINILSYNLIDERITLKQSDLYILYKSKTQEILGITDNIEGVNKILTGL